MKRLKQKEGCSFYGFQHSKSFICWDIGQRKSDQDFEIGKLMLSTNWAKDGTLLSKTKPIGIKDILIKIWRMVKLKNVCMK